MKFNKILFFLTIISPVLTKTFGSRENHDDIIAELKLLLDDEDKNSEVKDVKYTVCDTKQCQIMADEIKLTMNNSVNPCDDFYEFMCGNWKTHNQIPPYAPEWGRVFKFQQIVFSRIKEVLETEPESSDILPVRQAKKWYRSCMNTGALEERGIEPLESILIQTSGWPMTMDPEEWDENDHTWQSIEEHYFHITGDYVFYNVKTARNKINDVVLSREYLPLEGEIGSEYRNYSGNDYSDYVKMIEGIVKIFVDEHKADVSKHMIKKDVYDLVEFEKKLYLLNHEYFDSMETTIDDFVNAYNGNITEIEDEDNKIEKIDFRHIIRRVFDMINYDIEDSSKLYTAENTEYWIRLTNILNETPKRTIINYIHWSFVSVMMKYTTESMRDLLWQYQSNELGIEGRQPRWLECVEEMKMTAAAAYGYTEKYFHRYRQFIFCFG